MLTVIGEALVDVVSRPGGQAVRHPGGSPFNVAVGLARLEHPVTFLGTWGDDDDGRLLEQSLEAEGVEIPLPRQVDPTSTAEAVLGEDGSADYDFSLSWDPRLSDEDLQRIAGSSDAVHTGSIAAALEPGADTVLRLVEAARGRALISLDPNCRPTITQDVERVRARIEELAARADLIKASDEDLLWLYPGSTLQESARSWQRMGAGMVVVTRGELGPWAVTDATGPVGAQVPATSTDVVDTVGAGDTFMAALISQAVDLGITGPGAAQKLAALDEAQVCAILARASDAAAVTVSRAGADLPRRAELEDLARMRPRGGADQDAPGCRDDARPPVQQAE
ncbi:carbohydrate kinase [Kocuria palustris]|uniref:carbohydrate kinase family protein n=1 Tax=Kocuria palustris TaxID=71999 RepID=UPI0011A0FA0C|nr:carbohydrate kinase [Kocuria palustris]